MALIQISLHRKVDALDGNRYIVCPPSKKESFDVGAQIDKQIGDGFEQAGAVVRDFKFSVLEGASTVTRIFRSRAAVNCFLHVRDTAAARVVTSGVKLY